MTDMRTEPQATWISRLAIEDLVPHIAKRMNALDDAAQKISLEPGLQELVRIRASQLNGCAYCLDEHSREAYDAGERARRLFALPVWREAPFFTARERAALELTEAITRITDGPVTDEVYATAAAQFTDVEMAELIWAITIINVWNRIAATARCWPFD